MMKGHVAIIQVIVLFAAAILAAGRAQAGAENTKGLTGDLIIGARAGYSTFTGYYKGWFVGSYSVGATLSYGNQDIVKYLMGEMDVFYSRYPLKSNRHSYSGILVLMPGRGGKSSYLEIASIAAGPVAYFPAAPHFQIYAGLSAMGSYVHLYTSRTDQNVSSLKPGLLAKAGFYFPIKKGFRLRVGVDYTLQYLSGKPLHAFAATGGFSYNFNPDEAGTGAAPVGEPGVRIDWYLTLAGNALRKGNIDEAKVNYQKALAIDRSNSEARDQLAAIKKAEGDYEKGMKLVKEKRYYEALPFLDSAGKYIPLAREEQDRIRKHLSMDITLLEKQGIELYEKGDYRGCINVMNRLLLIDPKNRVGLIYLPRAVKRQGALERLR